MGSAKKKTRMIFVLGDIHLPWCSWSALEQVSEEIRLAVARGDDVSVVQVGDLFDQRFWSKYPKEGDAENPQLEWDLSERAAERLHELIPQMTIIFGNHDGRIAKKATESLLPRQLIKTLDQHFDYRGWTWYTGNVPLEIDGVAFIHGDEFPIPNPTSAALKLGQSVCYGHTHQAHISHVVTFKRKLFSMNVGWLGNEDATAFNYSRKSPSRSAKGYGVIIDGVPHFIPL